MTAAALLAATATFAAGADWPDLSRPARAIGGGEHDAAVLVGIEKYFVVPEVPGARSNATEWYEYLTETRKVPPQNIKLLINADATRERIIEAARKVAGAAGKQGTLWFVFIGHGAPSVDGKDGLLVGVDAQQEAESLQERSVRRGEILKVLAASSAGSIRIVLDACFSGRNENGSALVPGLQPLVAVATLQTLDPRMAVLTAAKGSQFAGALPGANRPAFSYLVLGGLRGWAADKDGIITAGSLWRYAKNALAATLRGRDQTPDFIGSENAIVAISPGEKGPNLAKLAEATAGALPKPRRTLPVTSRMPRGKSPSTQSADSDGLPDFSGVDLSKLPDEPKLQKAQEALDKPDGQLFAEIEKNHPVATGWLKTHANMASGMPSSNSSYDVSWGSWTFHAVHLVLGALFFVAGFGMLSYVGRRMRNQWKSPSQK